MTTVFLDTECLGLDRMAPIWEFAAIRIEDDGTESAREHFQIRHNPGIWLERFEADAPDFAADYRARYDSASALWPWEAARRVHAIVRGGATIAGSNPGFDMERLLILLQRNGYSDPGWHYCPLDVPTLATGWIAGVAETPLRPWKSDKVSQLADVEPADYARHTALGDVEWTLALYRRVTGGDAW